MDAGTITLIGGILAVVGGKEAWAYYKKRLDINAKVSMHGAAGEAELRNEIKDMLEEQIQELKEQVKLLTDRLTTMEEERETDKKRIAKQGIKIALLSERLTRKFTSTGRNNPALDINTDISNDVE